MSACTARALRTDARAEAHGRYGSVVCVYTAVYVCPASCWPVVCGLNELEPRGACFCNYCYYCLAITADADAPTETTEETREMHKNGIIYIYVHYARACACASVRSIV